MRPNNSLKCHRTCPAADWPASRQSTKGDIHIMLVDGFTRFVFLEKKQLEKM